MNKVGINMAIPPNFRSSTLERALCSRAKFGIRIRRYQLGQRWTVPNISV